ncbi:hypothetical protein JCM19992_02950 [Thermostilla marina]
MLSRLFKIGGPLLIAAVLGMVWTSQAQAGGPLVAGHHAYNPAFDLFPQYYTPPGCTSLQAQLYVAPVPTPPVIGHTWITYQPLMPHEFLYRHGRTYYRRNADGGWTRTSVGWH